MTKKILPIVCDKTKDLSKKLTAINIAHLFFDITDTATRDLIVSGSYRYLDKFFITSSNDIATIIANEKLTYPIYVINGTIRHDFIENVVDVNEIIHKYTTLGIRFYNYREMRELKDQQNTHTHIDLDICLVGKIGFQTMITSIASAIDSIRNTKIIDDKYVFDNINTYYCGEKKDMLLQLVNVTTFIPIDIPKITALELYEQVKNTKMYNLIDKTRYNYVWRAYKQLREYLFKNTDIIQNENIKSDNINPKIILCIDISKIDSTTKFIDLTEEFKQIIPSAFVIHKRMSADSSSSYGSTPEDREKLFVLRDMMAVGTEKIMNHYMGLFDQYGLYSLRRDIRDNKLGILIPNNIYNNLHHKSRLITDIQLYEHINNFGDMVLSSISNISTNCGLIIKSKALILVTYYGIYEQFEAVKSVLESLGYTVYNFSYLGTFNEGGDARVVDDLKKLISQTNADYVLWWVFNIGANSLRDINKSYPITKHLYFNWDEPYNWKLVDAESKSRYLSTAFITCTETTVKYIGAGALHAYCLYPGYTPSIHRPEWLDRNDYPYDVDVSFICTNLYDNPTQYPDQIVDRKSLVESIYHGQKIYGYTFSIYGPEKFKEIFPLSYKGFIKYENTNSVFNRSRINICTHVVGNKKGYLNERVFLVMGSGGLLLVDPLPGVEDILINGINCIFINQAKICQQIKSIIDNYAHYQKIKQNAYETAKNYTWDDWAMRLEEKLLQDYS